MLVGGDELMMEDTNMLFVSGIWGMNSLARSIASCPRPNIPAAPPAAAVLSLSPRPLPQTISRGLRTEANDQE